MVVPVRALVALALAMLCSGNVPGTAGLTFSGDVDWWRRGVIYQVYPRSFQDGCDVGGACSGTGTLSGITRRLDYLADLGVTTIWISPIYDSPMVDFGYDISNYTAVWPTFGDMASFDALLARAKRLGLRVLLDLVPNHSSDQHPWSSRDNPKRDWYVWADPAGTDPGTGTPTPPSNWKTIFCQDVDPTCSAWQYDAATGQYYYHQFLAQQPDLNWRNPAVQAAMYDAVRFWLAKGVDGFRVDAFAYLFETEDLTADEPASTGEGYHAVVPTNTENVAPLQQQMANLSKVVKAFGPDRVLVGEVYADPPVITDADVLSFYGSPAAPSLDMPFNFILVGVFQPELLQTRNAAEVQRRLMAYYTALPRWAQPNHVLGNHDNARLASRVGPQLARLAEVLLLTLRGTPTIYNGDELGMTDGVIAPGQRQDPATPSRDPERVPMPWSHTEPSAGFTGADVVPWLPVWQGAATLSVDQQIADQCSSLNLHRWLLQTRKRAPALNGGQQTFVDLVGAGMNAGNRVLVHKRSPPPAMHGSCFTVVANFDNASQSLAWTDALGACGNGSVPFVAKVVATSSCGGVEDGQTLVVGSSTLTLQPEQAVIIEHAVTKKVCRDPAGFAWGTATASYQVEGGAALGGRGASVWDAFAKSTTPDNRNHTYLMDNGDISVDHYHRWPDDIQLLIDLGVSHYRLSISWSRIMPTGRLPVSESGIAWYTSLLQRLRAAGITPFVTLYHWDLPQALHDDYGGLIGAAFEADFLAYADVCFARFGAMVDRWLTFNEPLTFCQLGYGEGIHAPGRCSDRDRCAEGNSSTEPYNCAHNVLRAHGAATERYRQQYADGKGQIGITLNSDNGIPRTDSAADKAAAERFMVFQLGWYADPLYFGDYPVEMRRLVGDRLPQFSQNEKARFLANLPDFYGMNHYTSRFISACSGADTLAGVHGCVRGTFAGDQQLITSKFTADGNLIGPQAQSAWLNAVPSGFRSNLNFIAKRFASAKPEYAGTGPPIYVTENGCSVPGETELPLELALNDTFRVDFYRGYTDAMMEAVHEDGVDIRGYFAWSLVDNFEWADGYNVRFGVYFADYCVQCGHPNYRPKGRGNCTRYPKASSVWFKTRIAAMQAALAVGQCAGRSDPPTDASAGSGLVAGLSVLFGAFGLVLAAVLFRHRSSLGFRSATAPGAKYRTLTGDVGDVDGDGDGGELEMADWDDTAEEQRRDHEAPNADMALADMD